MNDDPLRQGQISDLQQDQAREEAEKMRQEADEQAQEALRQQAKRLKEQPKMDDAGLISEDDLKGLKI